MYFPILINWTSPFPILGLLVGIFIFYSNFIRNSGETDQTLRFAVSDLVLHCLPMSDQKDARHIWVKEFSIYPKQADRPEIPVRFGKQN